MWHIDDARMDRVRIIFYNLQLVPYWDERSKLWNE